MEKDRAFLAELKLKKLDILIRSLDEQLNKSLNPFQKDEMNRLNKYTLINLKKPRDWKHRTHIQESRSNLDSSWDKNQLKIINEMTYILYKIQGIYKTQLARSVSLDSLTSLYRLYYLKN